MQNVIWSFWYHPNAICVAQQFLFSLNLYYCSVCLAHANQHNKTVICIYAFHTQKANKRYFKSWKTYSNTQKRLCCFRLVNVAVALGEVLFFCSLFYSTFFLFYVIRFIQLNLKSSPRSSLSSSHQKYLLSPFTVSYKKKTCLNYILKHIYPEASPTELSETYFWVNGVKLILALLGNMWGTLIWKGTFILK